MKRIKVLKTIFTAVVAVLLGGLVGAMIGCSCEGGYDPKHNIEGITTNAVLFVEHNRLSFAKDMTIDAPDIIEKCGLTLEDDSGNSVKVTAKHLREGNLYFENFDLSSAGTDKKIKISYRDADNYIVYDVGDYSLDFWLDEGKTELYKSVSANAVHNNDLNLAVWADLADFNYAIDPEAREKDLNRAMRFNGWYDSSETLIAGRVSFPTLGGVKQVLSYHAHFIEKEKIENLDLKYEGNDLVFFGYRGEQTESVTVPESVTKIDFHKLFEGEVNFTKLEIPSTARIDLPISGAIDSKGLTEITVAADNPYVASYNGALYSKDFKKLYFMPASSLDVNFHSSLTSFESYSCAYWRISSLSIPETVTALGHYCFAHSSLMSVYGLDNVQNIMTGVFYNTAMSIDNGVALYTAVSGTSDRKYNLSMILDKTITEYTLMDGTVGIDGDAFNGCTQLKKVNLGDELVSIGSYAFSECTSLESIDLPSTVRQIGSGAFGGCSSLETVTGLGDVNYSETRSVYEHTLPARLFHGCKNLKSVTIAEGITAIGDSAFYDCASLSELTIPSTVKTIGASAFYACGFKQINLPASLESMGKALFSNSKLESIDFSTCPLLEALPERGFEYTQLKTVTIPDRFIEIPGYCFYYVRTLTSVNLGKTETIGDRAFGYCAALKTIDFGSELKTIKDSAFTSCTGLTEVVIPDTVTDIESYAFRSCTKMTKITLGKNVKSFGKYEAEYGAVEYGTVSPVLYSCSELKEIAVAEGNTEFKAIDGVLYGRTTAGIDRGEGGVLITVPLAYARDTLTLGSQVKVVLPYSVHSSAKLVTVNLNEGLEVIGKAAFYNSKKIKSLTVPASVKQIGASILLNCTGIESFAIDEGNTLYSSDGNLIYRDSAVVMYLGLSENVRIREGIVSINQATFMNSKAIKTLVIADSVTEIGSKAFNGCTGLTSIAIGAGVKDIDPTAFAALSALESITVSENNPYFKVADNILYSKDGKKLLLCAAKNGTTELKIEAGVTEIADYAFSYHATLKTVVLPEGVTKVGSYAFYECRMLESFVASLTLESIGERAFSFATSINPDDKTETRHCDTLKTVMLFGNLKSIGDYAFYGHYGIEKLYYKMTINEVNDLLSGSGTNIVYLTRGCPKGATGTNYNDVKKFLYIETQPDEFTINYEGYGWFRLVDGKPVEW